MKYFLMIILIIAETIVIVLFHIKTIYAKTKSTNETEQLERDTNDSTNLTYIGENNRRHFRIMLIDINCTVELLELEDPNFYSLLHKKFNAQIENISISGMKIVCKYNLPFKKNTKINVKFCIKNIEFSLNALILRKEEYLNNGTFGYGIQFIEVKHNDEAMLFKVLNQLLLTRKRESV